MAKFLLEYEVRLEGDVTHRVVVDQRDWARMEVQEFPASALLTRGRFLAWSAMTRQGMTAVKWDEFNERLCVDIEDIGPESEGEQSLDPGRTTPSTSG